MDVFTKRNAVVGYATLRAASHYVERRRKARARARAKAEAQEKLRSSWKPALYVGLGLVSFGILAGLAYARRKSSARATQVVEEATDAMAAEVGAVAEELSDEAEPLIEAATEPVSAT